MYDKMYGEIIEAMQEYHKAKMKEVTDEDIQRYAEKKWTGRQKLPEIISFYSAKAMRDGEIKHIEK